MKKVYVILVVFVMVIISSGIFSACQKGITDIKIDMLFYEGPTFPIGASIKFKATVSPENARNASIKWSSSNSSVATITEDGNMLTVGIGRATIICTTEDGKHSDSMSISVVENYAADIRGKYKGAITIDDDTAINDVLLDMITISGSSNNIILSLVHTNISIDCNATISFNGNYDIQGEGFFNVSTPLTVKGNVNSETTATSLVFTINSQPSKKITDRKSTRLNSSH